MRRFTLQPRTLCLLALFQLVAGPLVLLQVTWFCTLTVRELPRQSLPVAMAKAWHNEQFQALLEASDETRLNAAKSLLPGAAKGTVAKAKMPAITWDVALCPPVAMTSAETSWAGHAAAWTPRWPLAPPGPPPRQA